MFIYFIYNNLRYQKAYNVKKSTSITYFYYCSQRDCLSKKPKKHCDTSKHRDRQSMNRFSCNGCLKITIHEGSAFSDIEMQHILHPVRPDTSIPAEIKRYILDNIDLLPREIYKRLVENGLSINIRQKQIHFWWTELGKNRYKRDDDPFLSAQKWLEENSYEIVFKKENPKAFGFLTELWNTLKNAQFEIREIGVDATCKYMLLHNLFYIIYNLI